MSNQEAFYSQLYQYIEKIANQVSDLRGSDTIKTGTIIQVLPGHYVVQLNEGNEQSSVKAIALNTSDLFSLQDYVYLMQATGSIENTYFIIGKVEQIQEDFLNLTLTERFTSSNELSGDLLKLNTKIEDLTILSDIKANRVFQIKGTFTCNKLNEENYGLKVSFNRGDQVIKTYNLDTNYFIGQPFEMTSQPQMRTILLDEVVLKSNFDNIIITTFGSNFTYSDITIASGSLLDVNGIVNVSLSFKNKKDYFSLSGTEVDNSVKVSAEVEYEGAPLVAPGIQYYWLLKDDSIDENSEYYFSYAGKDWKCLNTYDNVSGVGADGSSLTLQIWDSGENNIILSETRFPDFINTFKCIVKYQDIVVSSPETTIYNYNKESFFVELESNVQPPLLILETDQVILSAVVEDENEKTHMSDYTCAYQWQVENENGDWEVVTKKEVSEGVFEDTFAFNEYNAEHVLTKDWSKLTIVDQLLSDMEGDSSFYVLHGEGEEITKNFRCVVRVYRKDDLLNFVSEDFSESMQVVSKVAIAAQLVSTVYYKYYISDTPYTLFPKLENGEGDWEGDWSISIKRISEEEEEYFVSQNWTEDSNLAHWSSDDLQEFPSGKVNQDAYNYIIGKFIENSQNGSYLYITSQEVWVEERLGKINFLRKDNWTIPALAKGYSNNGNYLDDKAVDKLNTFTHLTEGGLNKGLLYDEDTGDLYINADFINTGALRVANSLGKEVLYADVDLGSVEVGGFTVDEYTLTSKNNNVGLNSNEAASSDAAIWVGQEGSEAYTKITHDGVLHAKGIIVEGNIEVKSSNTIATKKELEESSKQLSEDLDSAEKSWNKALEDQNKALLDELKTLDETTKKYIDSIEQDLQNQIDGSISSWFYEGVPTLDNAPASTWKDEEKGAHLGDLYYDLKTGKCYRWAQEQNGEVLEWEWVLVTDTDIALALENAAKAQATADGKITTFNGNNGTTLPHPPYQKGDLLVNAKENSSSDAQTYICVISKKVGESPSWEDWISIGNYATSSTLAAVENDLQSQIDARMSIWYYNGVPTVSNDPAKNWTTVELQKQHDKDLYYDLDTGRAYRWIYSASGNKWEEVLDTRITQALADAAKAQATADGKITTYKWTGSLPDPGYQEGDLLVGAKKNDEDDAQTYLCITSTTKNDSASWDHWTPIGDYTTTTMLETMQAALQTQIDGSISVWYESGMPSLTNEPAKNWSDDEKLKHDRDLYYDIDTGYCYRWECNATSKNGKWTQIEDERIEQALADAADAQSTADGKITSFYGDRPTTGYQYGDVWMEGETEAGTGKMYTCTVKNITGQLQDWKPVGDFVTGAEVEETIKATQDEIGELINDLDARVTASTYFSTAELESTSGKKIPAIVMKAKDDAGNGVMYFSTEDLVINSQNLRLNHNGSKYYKNYLYINTTPLKLYNNSYMTINTTPIKLNYSNSKYSLQINTDNFKIDSDGDVTIIGKVTATSLEIDPDAAGKAGLATSSDLSEVSSVASQAQSVANNAQTAAAGAQSVANAANTTATNAQTAAAGAQSVANNAAKDAGEAKTAANTAAKDASDAKSTAGTAAKDASDAAKDASQAKTTADGAAKDASDAKGVADQAKGIADDAAKDASDAKDIADGAKGVADQAKDVADTAKTTADTALETANGTSKDLTLLTSKVDTLSANTKVATYFGVDTTNNWIYLKSKTDDLKSPGMIYFDTDNLIINSSNLKLNHNGQTYADKYFMINTDSFSIDKNQGTICGINMGKKMVTYVAQSSAPVTKTPTIKIDGKWFQVGSMGEGAHPIPIYSCVTTIQKSSLTGIPENALIVGASITSPNEIGSSKYPQIWVSSFTKDSITCIALNTSQYGRPSVSCSVSYIIVTEDSADKEVYYLNTIDNSFYIRTATGDTKYAESFIQDLDSVLIQSEHLISNTADIGRLKIDQAKISCEGMDIDFAYEIGDNNTRLGIDISNIGNLILLTANATIGQYPTYDIQFVIRYKLSGNENYFYTNMTLPAGQSYVTKLIDSSFAVTEVAVQHFSNADDYVTDMDIDIRDDVNGYSRGIGIGGGMLVPKGKYNSTYGTWIGGGLGSDSNCWGWVVTKSLSLRNVEMPTIEYGTFVVGDGGDNNKNWHSRTIELSGVYANTNPPIILATIEPNNNASTSTLYVRASASVSDHKATATFNYRRSNDGTATIKWIAISKVIA